MTTESRHPSEKLPPRTGPRPPADPSPADPSPADPSPADRSAALIAHIRAEIDRSPERRITFARFMELALYEPQFGYYRQTADRPTDAGDFLTAPETHPIFGWTIARRIERMWAELGRPDPFSLIEYGAGSGTLALSILDGMRRHGADDLVAATRYEPIESNPHRLADLRSRFEEAGLSDRLAAAGAPSDGSVPVTGVLLANEFLDAMPVHKIVVRGGELLELFVEWRDGFVEFAAPPSTTALARRMSDDGIDPSGLADGQIGEICLGLEPWLDEVAARLARGYVLAIDYGCEAAELYGPRHLAGTLLGYRGHRVVDDPFTDPGLIDLTAHVDFTALQVLGERCGLRSAALTTQSEFLVASGLESELRALQESRATTAENYLRARSGIVRMLDPRHMGRFRVLELRREVPPGPIG
jgi:SAM-dependent MidA family methyltransferase